jgi:dienelactone hydrolase
VAGFTEFLSGIRRIWAAIGVSAWLLAIVAEGSPYQVPASHRVTQAINREWTFNYLPAQDADRAGCQAPGFDDSAWPAVAVPHTWQTYETTGKIHPFIYDASEKENPYWWHGWGWYRKHFSVGKELATRKVFVEFEGVQKYCEVWLNGKRVGDHKGGYNSFSFDLTPLIRFGEDNLLAVAVNNRQNDAFRIPPMSAGNWNTYGGIYREVRLVITDPLYVPFQGSASREGGTFVTTPKVSESSAEVRVRTWVQNDSSAARPCELRTTIADTNGEVMQVFSARKTIAAGELAEFDQASSPILRPHLWSPETPYVYKVFSDVLDAGTVADHFESPLGIRQFKWDYEQNRLILNGKKVIIHGSNRHQEYPWLGDAVPQWLNLLDMRDFKYGLNHNFMRTAHYTQAPYIYDFCDRNGIMVIEELPNDKRQEFAPDVQVQQLRETIRRDRNHPSIFFWSMGNETDHAADSKYALEEDASRLIHARDIYNDSAGQHVNTTSKQIALESLLRCTVRGWYNSDVRDLEPESAQQTGTETWQHDKNAQEIVQRNRGRASDDLANLNTWLYEDHGCNRDYANAPLRYVNPKGYVDCWRTPKYFYYLWQAVYAEQPMVFIHPHFWRAQYLGQKKEIVVDSNCDSVELKVNGRSVGTLKPQLAEANVLRFENVPITEGVLTAEGRKGGARVTARVVMAGPPARLALSFTARPYDGVATNEIEAALDSVALVRTDIVDAQGNHVYGATNTLQWSASGPATLVGAPAYSTDIDKCQAAEGTMYIDAPAFNIVRAAGQPGEVKVRVRSPGLAPAEVVLKVKTPLLAPDVAVVQPSLGGFDKRRPVASERSLPGSMEASGQEMKGISEDLRLHATGLEDYRRQMDGILRNANPALDPNSPEYRAVVQVFARLLQNNKGSLVRDDFNFTAGFYNDSRRITRDVDQLKVPAVFKASLHEHYARTIIEQGEAKDYAAEKRWLESLPSGRVVVAGAAPPTGAEPGVLYADSSDLDVIVTLAQPEFKTVPEGRKQALLEALCSFNPTIKRRVVKSGGKKVEGVRQKTTETVTYEVEKGQPILVPSLEELQKLGRKRRQEQADSEGPEPRAGPELTAARVQEPRKQIGDNFFVPDPLPALDALTHRRFNPAPGVRAEAVSYTTQFGMRVPAILYLPDPMPKVGTPSGKIPAFIVVNGHGGDKYCWYSWYSGILFARGGAAVLTYDQIGEGERNRDHRCGSRAHDNIKGDAVLARELMGLMITDVRQAVSYLAQRPEVDPQRIAAGGYSLGSFVLALAGAVEPRLRACVLVGGGNLDGPDGRWDSSNKKMCEAQPYQSLSFLGDRPAVLYALHAARGPTLVFNGLGDSVVGIPKHGEAFFNDLRQRTAHLHGGMAGVAEVGFAPTNASHRPYFITRPVVLWLEKQLDFPNWSEAGLQAMPETKIGPWAEKNGVQLDKLYATEEREAGTLALGADVPGYTREMLDVFTPQEWASRKKECMLETWVEAAHEQAVSSRASLQR